MHDTSLLSSSQTQASNFADGAKRAFDVLLSLLALICVLPLLIVIAVLIHSRDPGPVVFRHIRVGKDGKSFACLKFRSMVSNSDEVLAEVLKTNPEAKAEWDSHRKLTDDPRILGRLGRFLRASGIDELPQLWNILRGDMSFVGPRPVTTEELGYYGANVADYFSLRPGLTGKWQVKRQRDTTFDERVKMDVDYARNRTFLTDLWIIAATPFALASSSATT